jgi:para-aminobenzoate synthetase component I
LENVPKYLFYFNPNEHANGFKNQLLIADTATFNLSNQDESAFFVSYDFKNQIETNLKSKNVPLIKIPDVVSIIPEKKYLGAEAEGCLSQWFPIQETAKLVFSSLSKAQYYQCFNEIIHHIQLGDIYEMNYCIAFRAKGKINPYKVYQDLNSISHAPFSAFVKLDHQYIISSSPERFLKLESNVLITEPIKGTSARYLDKKADEASQQYLLSSLKERTENVMIVDVARNDLSRVAIRNSVNVEQLFGIYSFEQVHQMISKITCDLKENTSFQEIIHATFPMASMTGAPKIRAMQMIDNFENFSRGAYSGTIGYKNNDCLDSNVLIRSIFYDALTEDVCFAVGSAITAASNADDEWNELMMKAKAMRHILTT